MAVKERVNESVISVPQAVIEFVLFDGCFGKLIKLILIQTIAMKWKKHLGLIEFPYEENNFEMAGEEHSSKI